MSEQRIPLSEQSPLYCNPSLFRKKYFISTPTAKLEEFPEGILDCTFKKVKKQMGTPAQLCF